jgi:hypothetical protein
MHHTNPYTLEQEMKSTFLNNHAKRIAWGMGLQPNSQNPSIDFTKERGLCVSTILSSDTLAKGQKFICYLIKNLYGSHSDSISEI